MYYKFIVGVVSLSFFSRILAALMSFKYIFIYPPKLSAILLFYISTTLFMSIVLFSFYRLFRFKKAGLTFLPERYVAEKLNSYTFAKIFAWLGHGGLLFALFLRFFTYQYAGALTTPLLCYIICICITEISISNWYKGISMQVA